MSISTTGRPLRSTAASVITMLILMVGTSLVAPAANASTAAKSGGPSTCISGLSPVLLGGQWYCPGYVIGVKRTTYGTGTRIVLRGVTVFAVSGTTVTVSGGPSCLTPTTSCGATIPSVAISMSGLSTRPATGDIIDVYGVTSPGSLRANGYIIVGSSGCAPDFC